MKRSTPYRVNRPADRVLHALSRYQYLTLNQATLTAGFSAGSRTWVSTALKSLTDNHYTAMRRLSNRSAAGGGLGYWILSRRGIRYLDMAGVSHLPRISNGFDPDTEDYRIRHILAVNDVLIACERYATQTPGVTLHELIHDLYLQREPFTVDLGEGRTTKLCGDGWVELTAFERRYRFWLELDRGTEPVRRWKSKTEAIVRYAETLGETAITVLVVTTAGEKRLDHLLRWTAEQLAAMNRHAWADLFRFTAQSIADCQPQEVFSAPVWFRPFEPEPLWLIGEGRP